MSILTKKNIKENEKFDFLLTLKIKSIMNILLLFLNNLFSLTFSQECPSSSDWQNFINQSIYHIYFTNPN